MPSIQQQSTPASEQQSPLVLQHSPSPLQSSPALLQQSPAEIVPIPVPIQQAKPAGGGATDPSSPCPGSCVFRYNLGTNHWDLISSECQDPCYCEFPNEQNQTAPSTYPPKMTTEIPVNCQRDLGTNYFQLQLEIKNGGITSNIRLPFILDRAEKLQHPHNYVIPAGKTAAGVDQFWEVNVQYDPTMSLETMPVSPGTGPKSVITYPGGTQEFIHSATANEFTYQFRGYNVTVRHK